MSLPKDHREETERLIRLRSSTASGREKIALWLLNEGYYPEQYVLPPCFKIKSFKLKTSNLINLDSLNPSKAKEFANISFPKTDIMSRTFSIIHPKYYHDIVFWLINSWNDFLDILFDPENLIYSYSFPIPLNSADENGEGQLRSGRMIYEFLEMAEKDLVTESHRYKYIVKIDITNFYNSVYTHTIAWAWFNDRKKALSRKNDNSELGNQLDKLFQCANDAKSNGLPVGPVVSDLIVEFLLSNRDKVISERIKGIDFIATRFKDDYRFLVKTEDDAKKIIKNAIDVLSKYNLLVNEKKTEIFLLPQGLYREHSQKYEHYSLRNPPYDHLNKKIPFKKFEATLLKVIEIHRAHPGTGIIEKFLSEITIKQKVDETEKEIFQRLRIEFLPRNIPKAKSSKVVRKNIRKTLSLLIQLIDESPKSLSRILAVIECIYMNPEYNWLRNEGIMRRIVSDELGKAILEESSFKILWWYYFNERHKVGSDLSACLKELRENDLCEHSLQNWPLMHDPFIKTLRGKRYNKSNIKDPFEGDDHDVTMFKEIDGCSFLLDHLDIFNRDGVIPDC